MSMHTIRRYEFAFDRLSEAFGRLHAAAGGGGGRHRCSSLSDRCALAFATWSVNDPSWNNATSAPVRNLLGAPGAIAADLLIQVFGLAAAAVLLPPAAWGLRLLRRSASTGSCSGSLLWGVGALALAATASALPPTSRWPLLTGLGGVVGDGVLGRVRSLAACAGLPGGARGPRLRGRRRAGLTAACRSAASRARRRRDDEPDAPARAGTRRVDERDDDARDEEPSWAIIALGALAHAAMSLKSALRRRVEAGLEATPRVDEDDRRPAPARAVDRPAERRSPRWSGASP